MILIPLPDPLDHHALALAKLVAATSWLPSANVVSAADENLSQGAWLSQLPKSAALAPQEICTDLIQSGISDVNPLAKWRFHPNSQAHLWRTNRCSIIWKHRSNRRSESRQISRQNGGIGTFACGCFANPAKYPAKMAGFRVRNGGIWKSRQ